MSDQKFLDNITGLPALWDRIKEFFALKTEIPKNTSQLVNDRNYKQEDIYWFTYDSSYPSESVATVLYKIAGDFIDRIQGYRTNYKTIYCNYSGRLYTLTYAYASVGYTYNYYYIYLESIHGYTDYYITITIRITNSSGYIYCYVSNTSANYMSSYSKINSSSRDSYKTDDGYIYSCKAVYDLVNDGLSETKTALASKISGMSKIRKMSFTAYEYLSDSEKKNGDLYLLDDEVVTSMLISTANWIVENTSISSETSHGTVTKDDYDGLLSMTIVKPYGYYTSTSGLATTSDKFDVTEHKKAIITYSYSGIIANTNVRAYLKSDSEQVSLISLDASSNVSETTDEIDISSKTGTYTLQASITSSNTNSNSGTAILKIKNILLSVKNMTINILSKAASKYNPNNLTGTFTIDSDTNEWTLTQQNGTTSDLDYGRLYGITDDAIDLTGYDQVVISGSMYIAYANTEGYNAKISIFDEENNRVDLDIITEVFTGTKTFSNLAIDIPDSFKDKTCKIGISTFSWSTYNAGTYIKLEKFLLVALEDD